MKRLKCLMVDDEQKSLDLLKQLVEVESDLLLVEAVKDPRLVKDLVYAHGIELVFVDLHMEHIHGIDLIRSLRGVVEVIVCSAHKGYDVDVVELEIAFFLEKPFDAERLRKAIDRVWERKVNGSGAKDSLVLDMEEHVFLPRLHQQLLRIQVMDIECIEANEKKCLLTYTDGECEVNCGIGEFEKLLPAAHFIRVHRSFIVALKNTSEIDLAKGTIKLRNSLRKSEVPIGRAYKEKVAEVFRRNQLSNGKNDGNQAAG